MNTLKVIETAHTIFPDFNQVEDNIFRGTLFVDNKTAGVCYFDFSTQKKENFNEFQEKLLSTEFYSNPGALQWNYYLFLLNDQLTDDEIIEIEKNDKYARKYVLNEEKFKDFFNIEYSDKTVQPDIISQWKKSLDDADLQEVYGQDTYVSIFERFSNNTTKRNVINSRKNNVDEVRQINFINKLKLKENYRKFPKVFREFDFGKVNLFSGINGVGKTSIFEAIELMLCGQSFRNSEQRNPDGCLEANYNGDSTLEKFKSKDHTFYQNRELLWYSSANNRGNTLSNSFNRFNYFNADAAYNFANGNTYEDVNNALFSIVLGPEFSHLQERCAKMLDKLRPEFNKIKNSFQDAENELNGDRLLLTELSDSKNIQHILGKIENAIEFIPFTQKKFDVKNNLSEVESLIRQINNALIFFKDNGYLYDTLNDIKVASGKFETKKNEFKILLREVKLLGRKGVDLEKVTAEIHSKLSLLVKVKEYLDDPISFELGGLSDRLSELKSRKNRIEYINKVTHNINLKELVSENSHFSIYEQSINKELLDKRNLQAKLKTDIEKDLKQLGTIEELLKEIKSKGLQFIKEVPTATDCPLCGEKYSRPELENRITKLLGEDLVYTDQYRIKDFKIKELFTEIFNLDERKDNIEKIKDLYYEYFGNDPSTKTIGSVVAEILRFKSELNDVDRDLEKLGSISAIAVSSGKTEEEFKELNLRLSQEFKDEIKDGNIELDFINHKIIEFQNAIAFSKNEFETVLLKRGEIGLEIKLLLGIDRDTIMDPNKAEEIIEKEGKVLDIFKNKGDILQILLEIDEFDKFSNIEIKIANLMQDISIYSAALLGEFEIKLASDRVSKNEKFIEDNRDKLIRFEKAYNCLVDLTSDNATKKIEEFFKRNLSEIIDIFKAIHFPREFSDLKYENKRLTLITDDDGKRSLTEISTGQRSALALSIFLSLNNKLLNGPEIIMFDDPVAFIDDLNALSFLDYLRLHVLKTGKQIFFATANKRLAHLFEKKFLFLENDFKQWNLERA
ncbi:AAA family ATPase [Sphingobacterium sp.]|uniref:AAA family ATPase n=1 Tax=Sphingobacterium sp. TaxID=341027 RepID=UPI002898E228|nr:AAA family ATPase [Sphingobacterium sp.]